MSDDIRNDWDALLWLRSKQGQYAGYEKGSQDDIRHQYFKAAADELERLRSRLSSATELIRECRDGGNVGTDYAIDDWLNGEQ